MIPIEWWNEVEPPLGCLLVERCRMETLNRAGLYIPDTYRDHTLVAEARVHATDDVRFAVGEHVLISDMVGRSIVFGYMEERVLWLVKPEQVLAKVTTEEPVDAEFHREAAGYRSPRRDQDTWDRPVFEEGDSRGPR